LEKRYGWLVGLLAVVFLSAIQLVRQPGARSWDTIWAEDGNIFATDALADAWTTSVFRGYAGYVQVESRLLALPLRLLPAAWWAAWLAASAALVTSLLAIFVYQALDSFVASRLLRASVTLTTAVSPAMWFEANANVANLVWPLLFAGFWALMYRSTSRPALAARMAVLVTVALSTPLAVLYLPLALLISWQRRTSRRELSVTGAFLAALVVQIVVDDYGQSGRMLPGLESVKLFFVRVVGSAVIGERWLGRLWSQFQLGLAIALGVGLAAFCVLVGRHLKRSDLQAPLLALAASVVFFGVPVWLRGLEPLIRLDSQYNPNGSRYVIVPALLLISAIVCVADRAGNRWLRIFLSVQMIVVVVSSLALSNGRGLGPPWRDTVAANREVCRSLPAASEAHLKTSPAAVHWYVRTTCGRLR